MDKPTNARKVPSTRGHEPDTIAFASNYLPSLISNGGSKSRKNGGNFMITQPNTLLFLPFSSATEAQLSPSRCLVHGNDAVNPARGRSAVADFLHHSVL
jgi:hypothetical protein